MAAALPTPYMELQQSLAISINLMCNEIKFLWCGVLFVYEWTAGQLDVLMPNLSLAVWHIQRFCFTGPCHYRRQAVGAVQMSTVLLPVKF